MAEGLSRVGGLPILGMTGDSGCVGGTWEGFSVWWVCGTATVALLLQRLLRLLLRLWSSEQATLL